MPSVGLHDHTTLRWLGLTDVLEDEERLDLQTEAVRGLIDVLTEEEDPPS